MIASARMYEWTPALSAMWRRLLAWAAARARVDLEIVQSRSVSLDEIWAREDMGCVFMCGYPYALRERRPELLCAPVPAPPRYGGQPVYVTDFIVRGESGFRALEDTFGGRIAYSTPCWRISCCCGLLAWRTGRSSSSSIGSTRPPPRATRNSGDALGTLIRGGWFVGASELFLMSQEAGATFAYQGHTV